MVLSNRESGLCNPRGHLLSCLPTRRMGSTRLKFDQDPSSRASRRCANWSAWREGTEERFVARGAEPTLRLPAACKATKATGIRGARLHPAEGAPA